MASAIEIKDRDHAYATVPEAEEPPMVEVPISPQVIVETNLAPSRGRCFVNSCCCGCTLATGVAILGALDILYGAGTALSAFSLLIMGSKEGKIDSTIEHLMLNRTETETEETVAKVNAGIEAGAAASPLILLFAAVAISFGMCGLKASKGDIASARHFYGWKAARAAWVVVMMLIGEGNFVATLIMVYFAVVARSHFIALAESQTLPMHVELVHAETHSSAPGGSLNTPTPAVTQNPITLARN